MGIKEIVECYDFIKGEHHRDVNDFLVALEIMIISDIKLVIKEIIDKNNQKLLTIIAFLLDNGSVTIRKRFMNKCCYFLISNCLNAKEKISILNKLRKINSFVVHLPKTDCWFYESPLENERSFLGMIISELSFFEPRLFKNFLKKKSIKSKVVKWLYDVLKQNEARAQLEGDISQCCSDKFILNISNELVNLYLSGKNPERNAEIDISLIYDESYPIDFGQEKREIQHAEKRSFFNEYFLMAIKGTELGILSLITMKEKYESKIQHILRLIEYLKQYKEALSPNPTTDVFYSRLDGIIDGRLQTLELDKQRLYTNLDNINAILGNRSICTLNLDLMTDLLFWNKEKMDLFPDRMIEIILTIMNESLKNHIYIDKEVFIVLRHVVDSEHFNYHTKIKVIEMLVKYNNLLMRSEPTCIDIDYIDTLHRFYLEIGAKGVDDYYKIGTRHHILCLVNLFIYNNNYFSDNTPTYLLNFKNGTDLDPDFVKFVHNSLSDLETVISQALSFVERVIAIEEKIKENEDNTGITPSTDVNQLHFEREDYKNLIHLRMVFIKNYIKYFQRIASHNTDLFRNDLLIEIFCTTLRYLLHQLLSHHFVTIQSELEYGLFIDMGKLIIHVVDDDVIGKKLLQEDQFDMIAMCKELVMSFFKNKEYSITPVAKLVYDLDSSIERLEQWKEKMTEVSVLTEREIPEEYMDPIMMCIMDNPIELPSSNIILDKGTIMQHLMHCEEDPYSREKLTVKLLEEYNKSPEIRLKMEALKLRINEWKIECV